jgi:hypothetical protein
MRKCALFSVALFFALSFSIPTPVQAQGAFLGAGATFPTGDYADFGDGDGANTGFMAFGGLDFPLNQEGLSVFGEGYFGVNSHDLYDGDKTNLYGAMGGVLFDFMPDGPGPYAFGQVGIMVHDYKSDDFPEAEGSETGLAFGGGAGYGFPLGGVNGFVEARYIQGQFDDGNTSFFGIFAGISFPLGGDDGM